MGSTPSHWLFLAFLIAAGILGLTMLRCAANDLTFGIEIEKEEVVLMRGWKWFAALVLLR